MKNHYHYVLNFVLFVARMPEKCIELKYFKAENSLLINCERERQVVWISLFFYEYWIDTETRVSECISNVWIFCIFSSSSSRILFLWSQSFGRIIIMLILYPVSHSLCTSHLMLLCGIIHVLRMRTHSTFSNSSENIWKLRNNINLRFVLSQFPFLLYISASQLFMWCLIPLCRWVTLSLSYLRKTTSYERSVKINNINFRIITVVVTPSLSLLFLGGCEIFAVVWVTVGGETIVTDVDSFKRQIFEHDINKLQNNLIGKFSMFRFRKSVVIWSVKTLKFSNYGKMCHRQSRKTENSIKQPNNLKIYNTLLHKSSLIIIKWENWKTPHQTTIVVIPSAVQFSVSFHTRGNYLPKWK